MLFRIIGTLLLMGVSVVFAYGAAKLNMERKDYEKRQNSRAEKES